MGPWHCSEVVVAESGRRTRRDWDPRWVRGAATGALALQRGGSSREREEDEEGLGPKMGASLLCARGSKLVVLLLLVRWLLLLLKMLSSPAADVGPSLFLLLLGW